MRLLAVGVLVAGNGLILTGGPVPGLWGAPLPRIGLDVLFAIAGFLAAESVGTDGFVRRRALRVFAALMVIHGHGSVLSGASGWTCSSWSAAIS